MKCKKCGAEAEGNFCQYCGASITTQKQKANTPANNGYSAPVYHGGNNSLQPPQAPKKNKKGWWWAASIFLFIGALVYFPHLSFIFLLLAGVAALPVGPVAKMLEQKGVANSIKGLAAAGLFFVSVMLAPSQPAAPPNDNLIADAAAIQQEEVQEQNTETAKEETEKKASEAAKAEAEKKAAEKTKAAEAAKKAEAEKKAAEEAKATEAAKAEAEKKAAEEAKATEAAKKAEAEKKAAEEGKAAEAAKKAEAEKKAAEEAKAAEAAKAEAEKKAAEKANNTNNSSTTTIEGPYAASVNSKVFHASSCEHVDTIKKANLIFFSTREQAVSGRRPCKDCNP